MQTDLFIVAMSGILNCQLMTHDQKLIAYAEQGGFMLWKPKNLFKIF